MKITLVLACLTLALVYLKLALVCLTLVLVCLTLALVCLTIALVCLTLALVCLTPALVCLRPAVMCLTLFHFAAGDEDKSLVYIFPKKTTLKHRLGTDDALFVDFIGTLSAVFGGVEPRDLWWCRATLVSLVVASSVFGTVLGSVERLY